MVCFYHSKDLDGICSGAIIKKAFPGCKMIGYDYGEKFGVHLFDAGEMVVMVDVSLPMSVMEYVASYSGNFVWIDHHKSAIEDFDANFNDGMKISGRINSILDASKSGCELAWQYCFPDKPLPPAVRLLGRYDVWDQSNTEEWESVIFPFQYGFRSFCSDLDSFPDKFLLSEEDSDVMDKVVDVILKGDAILSYQKEQNKKVCSMRSFDATAWGLRAICCNGVPHNSQSFDSVWDDSKYDLMMPFSFENGRFIVSLYTTHDHIDCSALAKSMGGGGHKKAAGFHLSIKEMAEFLSRGELSRHG